MPKAMPSAKAARRENIAKIMAYGLRDGSHVPYGGASTSQDRGIPILGLQESGRTMIVSGSCSGDSCTCLWALGQRMDVDQSWQGERTLGLSVARFICAGTTESHMLPDNPGSGYGNLIVMSQAACVEGSVNVNVVL